MQNPPYDYRPCCCCVANGGKKASFRAWLVPKGSNYGGINASHRAWFGTHAGNSNDAENNVKEKVQRRPKSGRGGGAAVEGSPDLLAIPTVGPRNLRKLVEKGFEGVAQLKQLYKTKEIDAGTDAVDRRADSGRIMWFLATQGAEKVSPQNLKGPGCKALQCLVQEYPLASLGCFVGELLLNTIDDDVAECQALYIPGAKTPTEVGRSN
ncbi:hypothetical protein CASFOL_017926 [Castilleja foliolosa]|uniref:Uncharacterized protein n=1 Tax=Castilleja foliolosa TaxID=1961234 RepID=A0ABD3D8C3_9LAMI